MPPIITARFADNILALDRERDRFRLLVNGVARSWAPCDPGRSGQNCFLDSVVQIGYEDHAYVTGRILTDRDHMEAVLCINGEELGRERYEP